MPLHRRVSLLFWSALPALITLFLLAFYLVPKRISGLDSFMPLLPMIPIFFWSVHYPKSIPYWFVFLIGIIQDSVTGQPLGLSSLLNIIFLVMIQAQYKYIHKEGFVIQWVYFCMLLLAITVLHFLLIAIFYMDMHGIKPALIQWFLTVCCYPLLHRGFEALHQRISQQRWLATHGR